MVDKELIIFYIARRDDESLQLIMSGALCLSMLQFVVDAEISKPLEHPTFSVNFGGKNSCL